MKYRVKCDLIFDNEKDYNDCFEVLVTFLALESCVKIKNLNPSVVRGKTEQDEKDVPWVPEQKIDKDANIN